MKESEVKTALQGKKDEFRIISRAISHFSEHNLISEKNLGRVFEKISMTHGEIICKLMIRSKLNIAEIPEKLLKDMVKEVISSSNLRTVYRLLRKFPNLPKTLKREGAGKIIFSNQPGTNWWLTYLLAHVPNLPKDLLQKGIERNHKGFQAEPKVIEALDSILPVWLVNPDRWPSGFYHLGERRIPVFANRKWKLSDRNSSGTLISYEETEVRREKVVLLPDVSVKGQGYAEEVNFSINTVHEAISWMFQQDPKKFKGFTKEV